MNPISWLAKHLDQLKPLPPQLDNFVRLLSEELPDEDVDPQGFLTLLKKIEGNIENEVAPTPVSPSDSRREPATVISDAKDNALAVSSKTDMFEKPYWRNKLLKSIWPLDMNGFAIRMAKATVGNSPEAAKIE